jgi:hypothetical protein
MIETAVAVVFIAALVAVLYIRRKKRDNKNSGPSGTSTSGGGRSDGSTHDIQ